MDALNSKKTIGQGKAKVLAVNPEEGNHQVRVYHPDLGYTEFIPYVQMAGIYRVPRVGDNCYVFLDENYNDYPIAWGHRLSKKLISELVGERADDITVIYSAGSDHNSITHKIELDDGEDNGIRITTNGKNQVELKDTEEITVKHNSGSFVEVSKENVTLSVKGSTITMGADGVFLESAKGGKVELTKGVLSESSEGAKVDLTAGIAAESSQGSTLDIDASINGAASDQLATFDKIIIKTHKHPGNLGFPTQPPIPEGE